MHSLLQLADSLGGGVWDRPITRGQFLRGAGAGAAGALLAGCGLPGVDVEDADGTIEPSSSGEKVVVVGAGISGLAAARSLSRAGYGVEVVEARSRVGGRIDTSMELGTAVDLGATWIHGDSGNPLSGLSRRWKLTTRATDFDAITARRDGRAVSDDEVESGAKRAEELYEQIVEGKEEIDRDTDIESGLAAAGRPLDGLDDVTRWWAASLLEMPYGADFADMSAMQFDEDDDFPGEELMFPGGFSQVPERLARGLDIRFESHVNRIEWGSGKPVTVHTNNGSIQSERVVVTLPLGVLSSGDVAFEPALPSSRRRAMTALAMGVLDKVALRFDEQFWPRQPHFFGIVGAGGRRFPNFLNLEVYGGEPVLVGFSYGRTARALERRPDREVVDEALAALREAFGKVPAPQDAIVTRWGSEPLSYGSYPYVPVGGRMSACDELARPVKNRLFFAGDATSSRFIGTTHGALLSGYRAARRLRAVTA